MTCSQVLTETLLSDLQELSSHQMKLSRFCDALGAHQGSRARITSRPAYNYYHDILGVLLQLYLFPSSEESQRALQELNRLSKLQEVPTLWTQEGEFESERTLHLLQSLSSLLAGCEEEVCDPILKKLIENSAFANLLKELLQGGDALESVQAKRFWHYPLQEEGFKGYFTPYGKSSGLGAIEKSGIQIHTFAPHLGELFEMDHFGISKEAEHTPLSTNSRFWTRMTQENKDVWLHFSWLSFEERLECLTRFEGVFEKPAFFTFFVSAEMAYFKRSWLLPGTIHQAKGESSKVELMRDGRKLTMQFSKNHLIELIPLAGKKYFWGADFLIAVQLGSNDSEFGFSLS